MEASLVLDRIYSTIHDPTPVHEFNKQEIVLAVDTSVSLQGILAKEIAPQEHIYSSGIALCHTYAHSPRISLPAWVDCSVLTLQQRSPPGLREHD